MARPHHSHTYFMQFQLSANASQLSVLHTNRGDWHPLQFHVHSPSEYAIDGRQFPMGLHIVHTNTNGDLLVVGIMLQLSTTENEFLAPFWSLIPHNVSGLNLTLPRLDLTTLLPQGRPLGYWNFAGSLTTPPCTEGGGL